MSTRYRSIANRQRFPTLRCTVPAPCVPWRGCSASSCPCCCDATSLNDLWRRSILCQPSPQPMSQGMESEPGNGFSIVAVSGVLLLQYPGNDCRRTNVVLDNHAAEPGLPPVFPVRGKNQIPVLCIDGLLLTLEEAMRLPRVPDTHIFLPPSVLPEPNQKCDKVEGDTAVDTCHYGRQLAGAAPAGVQLK
jgi:hypothetical protein